MKSPSFRIPGGKARLRKWLVNYFSKNGRYYVEPFAGLGNVFWYAYDQLNFNEWFVNDLLHGEFFEKIKSFDLSLLPEYVSLDDYRIMDKTSDLAVILEPRITLYGKGYKAGGFSGDCGTHIGYRRQPYTQTLLKCKNILLDDKVSISSYDFNEIDYSQFTEEDFIYFDPPYYNTSINCYPQIDHETLLKVVTTNKFKYLISGYPCSLYNSYLGDPITILRNAEMSSSQSGSQTRTECIWKNY